ncbi:hypothetical protein OGAPHI_004778 [Ogataea philodendri]|uniref:Metallo-beta-lactamase domain-containing protein n=1 Tax=Ogataea philodendri TaxID=1378263 RepID=A0A9P8P3M0_9ASCO|nr:uncharacterized protein OGAPHI_004778 [Ogataea philodendri]KAH3664064.1 hypothetical protein OGAPHI_004778 [Ogataea philodendri]
MVLALRWKFGLGVLAAYSGYTTYIYVRTQQEIRRRQQVQDAHPQSEDDGECDGCQYDTLTVNGRFENPFPEYRPQTIFEFFAMRVLDLFEFGKRGGLPSSYEELRASLPIHTPDIETLRATGQNEEFSSDADFPAVRDRLTFTWFGQSCSLVQIGSVSFLTDPLFENHLISRLVGPQRIAPSAIKLQDLMEQVKIPEYVLVSHDHPDHLEEESVKRIGNKSKWIVPVGVRRFLAKRGVSNVIEMKWWDRVTLETDSPDKYEVVCLPAMHWSGRQLIDTNKTLWCSFMILRNGKSIFFHCGDTGYSSDLFRLIGQKYGPVKFGALPIGQYCPQWHQRPRHISPLEAVRITNDMGIEKMVGVHWGTFILSSEKYMEPKEQLEELARMNGRQNSILVSEHGRTLVFDTGEIDTLNEQPPVQVRGSTVYR